MQTQISSGAAAVSTSGLNQQSVPGAAAAGAVPPSNYGALSVLNEENHSELALQSLDGAVTQKDFDTQSTSSKNGGKQRKEKKD